MPARIPADDSAQPAHDVPAADTPTASTRRARVGYRQRLHRRTSSRHLGAERRRGLPGWVRRRRG
jgi:hypothetical protein